MAEQKSIIKLKGRIGDLTFYETRNGFQAREAKGIPAARIATDPKFQRTRENGAEFGTAGRAAKRMRDALRPVIFQLRDVRMANRLSSRMLRIVKADAVNDRGARLVLPANIPMLKGFAFNNASQLENTFLAAYNANIDRPSGEVSVSIPAFNAQAAVVPPKGATHFQLQLAALSIGFDAGAAVPELLTQESGYLEVGELDVPLTELSVTLAAASVDPILLLFGIGFHQAVNARYYPLQNGAFNALSIIEVNGDV